MLLMTAPQTSHDNIAACRLPSVDLLGTAFVRAGINCVSVITFIPTMWSCHEPSTPSGKQIWLSSHSGGKRSEKVCTTIAYIRLQDTRDSGARCDSLPAPQRDMKTHVPSGVMRAEIPNEPKHINRVSHGIWEG